MSERDSICASEEKRVAVVRLTRDKVAVIDAADMPLVSNRSWQASLRRDGKGYYAVSDGLRMHRFLMGATNGLIVDHKDGDGLNNRRDNLRIGTQSQNCVNRKTTPGRFLRGVQPAKTRWRASIKRNGRSCHIGYYATQEESHEAYLREAKALHGEWVPLDWMPLLPPAPEAKS